LVRKDIMIGVPVDTRAVWAVHAANSPGSTLEDIARRLAKDIGELCDDGGLPAHLHITVTVLPRQRLLHIQVAGLSVEDDPDRTTTREVLNSLFELASLYNIVALDAHTPPLFTQRILLIGPDGRPFAAMIGSAAGDVEQLPASQ
jgi:hypothetical protein